VYEPIKLYTSATVTGAPCDSPMRTNIVIDDALMRQAMQASGARSKREAVELGLRTLVRLQQQGEIRSFRGRLQWEGDLEAQRLDTDQQAASPVEQELAGL
jgi:Arc/MetJ family transcription regulator